MQTTHESLDKCHEQNSANDDDGDHDDDLSSDLDIGDMHMFKFGLSL